MYAAAAVVHSMCKTVGRPETMQEALTSGVHLLGFGSVSREQMDSSTLLTVSAGLHWSFRMSRQMPPLLLMLQW
jgi:hypothetical protein